MVRNDYMSGNNVTRRSLLREVPERLRALLPGTWNVTSRPAPADREQLDGLLEISGPSGPTAILALEVKTRLQARDVERLAKLHLSTSTPLLVAAPFIGARTRQELRQQGLSFIDMSGNAWVALEQPAVYLERQGAEKNPNPVERPARSLRGGKAGRVVRTLIDYCPPLRVRQLGEMAGVDPGYASRLLALLDSEAVITRGRRGLVVAVDWSKLLRYWVEDYGFFTSNSVRSYLDPRGIENLMERLAEREDAGVEYAISGSVAARRFTSIAPARLVLAYVTDIDSFAAAAGLTPTESGANVVLAEPVDRFVFDRAEKVGGVCYVAPSQAAADLLTGTGRNPQEGEALLDWMRGNEDVWRRRS